MVILCTYQGGWSTAGVIFSVPRVARYEQAVYRGEEAVQLGGDEKLWGSWKERVQRRFVRKSCHKHMSSIVLRGKFSRISFSNSASPTFFCARAFPLQAPPIQLLRPASHPSVEAAFTQAICRTNTNASGTTTHQTMISHQHHAQDPSQSTRSKTAYSHPTLSGNENSKPGRTRKTRSGGTSIRMIRRRLFNDSWLSRVVGR